MTDAKVAPFKCDIRVNGLTIDITISGFIDARSSMQYQEEVEGHINRLAVKSTKVGLLYIEELSGFDTGSVAQLHGRWFSKIKPQVSKVAIVSSKASVMLALSIAKLITKTPLKLFDHTVVLLGGFGGAVFKPPVFNVACL